MGVSYYGVLAFATPLKMRSARKKVTRYHEVTGKPYEKEVQEYAVFIGDTEIEFDTDRIPEDKWDDLCDSQKWFNADGLGYFGIPLATVDPNYSEVEAINMTRLKEAETDYVKLVLDVFGNGNDPFVKALLVNGELNLFGIAY